jgi:4'-phosphopantetheinyl transferase
MDLVPHQVDIWRVRVNLSERARKGLESMLSTEEAERAARFHFPADRDRYITAHGCLRDILARYLRGEPAQLSFVAGTHGKPSLATEEAIDFNLSHSNDYALIAIARGRRVGIDVERMRKGISSFVIAQQYFSKAEVAELQALPIDEREVAFFTCWTRKEAYIKAQGLGLSLPLESFDVSLSPDEPAILRATRPDFDEASRWILYSLEVDPGYKAAMAVEINPPQDPDLDIHLWDWVFNH